MTGQRKFNGKIYVLKDWVKTKGRAEEVARKIRGGGMHHVRIGKVKGGYGLYLRTIGYRGR